MKILKQYYKYLTLILISLFVTSCISQNSKASTKDDLYKLFTEGSCRGCDLKNADLSHADLLGVDLEAANLSGANLSNAILDNSNLKFADLSYAILFNASLNNVTLLGAKLNNTDLRQADLTNTKIEINSLRGAFWRKAVGIDINNFSFEEIYESGLAELKFKNYPKAEFFLKTAISKNDMIIDTYLALFNVQLLQGKTDESLNTLQKIRHYYISNNDNYNLEKIENIILAMKENKSNIGNGIGIDLINTISSLYSQLRITNFILP